MATVLFGIYPAFSHLNASFKVARYLKDCGFRVFYADPADTFAEVITRQGFEFVKIDTDLFPSLSNTRYGLPTFFASYLNQWKLVRETNHFLRKRTMYDQLIGEVRPDLLIIDSLLSPFILMLLPYKIPIFTLQTMFPTEKSPLVPPIHSTIVPDGSPWATVRIEWAWWKYFAGRRLQRYVNKVRFLGTTPGFENLSLLKQISRMEKRSLDDFICFRRTLTFRLRNVAELVTAPRELDFPRSKGYKQYFLAGSIDVKRAEVGIDVAYEEVLAKLGKDKGEKYEFLIYCAFGTMGPQKSKEVLSFLRRLIGAVGLNQKWHLVLATGKQFEEIHVSALPANVSVFRKVPQLDILQKADLMITHGGLNSIVECIHFGVPMIAYPINSENDQNGNAARIQYHCLGIVGSIRKDSTSHIVKMINQVLSDSSYKIKISEMSRRIKESNGFEKAMTLIKASIN